jgi:hypothetical protein
MKGYQPRPNIVKHEKGDMVADSYFILVRWSSYFYKLFNIHGFNEVRKRNTQSSVRAKCLSD